MWWFLLTINHVAVNLEYEKDLADNGSTIVPEYTDHGTLLSLYKDSAAAGGRPGKGVECRDIVPGSDAFIDHWNPGFPLLEEQPGSILMLLFEEFSFYEIEILLMKRADYISQPFFIE